MTNKDRPSMFLAEKCLVLEKVLDFFMMKSGTTYNTVNDRLTMFLYQIDFWEWELENLIYSFDSYAERSKAWIGDCNSNLETIWGKHRIPVKKKAVGYWKRMYRRDKIQVIAPADLVNRVIGKWNELLNLCVERMFMSEKTLKTVMDLHADFIPDMERFKKQEWIAK